MIRMFRKNLLIKAKRMDLESIKPKCVKIFQRLAIVLIFKNASLLMGLMNFTNQLQLQKNFTEPNLVSPFGKKEVAAMDLDANFLITKKKVDKNN